MEKQKKFSESFDEIYPNLENRYAIKREMDVMNEFVHFSDNTRNIALQELIYEEIKHTNKKILNYISNYERQNEKDSVESSN